MDTGRTPFFVFGAFTFFDRPSHAFEVRADQGPASGQAEQKPAPNVALLLSGVQHPDSQSDPVVHEPAQNVCVPSWTQTFPSQQTAAPAHESPGDAHEPRGSRGDGTKVPSLRKQPNVSENPAPDEVFTWKEVTPEEKATSSVLPLCENVAV